MILKHMKFLVQKQPNESRDELHLQLITGLVLFADNITKEGSSM